MKRSGILLLILAALAILFASDMTSGNRIVSAARSRVFDAAVRVWTTIEDMRRSEQEADLEEYMRDFDQKVEWIKRNSRPSR